MNEYEFIQTLQKQAADQKHALSKMPMPHVYLIIVNWLGNHPWRILIPFAFLCSIVFRLIFGSEYTDFVLLIFRKL